MTVANAVARAYSQETHTMAADYKMIGADGREYEGSLEELREWASDGRLGHESLVWSSGEQRWLKACDRHEFQWDLPKPIQPPPVIPELPVAGFIPRLAAFLFDMMLLHMLLTLAIIPWRAEMTDLMTKIEAQRELVLNGAADGVNLDLTVMMLKVILLLLAVYAPISLIYWVGFNGRFGATPGKNMVGLRIVTQDGEPLGYMRAFRRYCAEQVSMLPFGLGYLMIAFSPTKQGLHDVLAGTKVIFYRRQ
jgi:uncharacterized RDD family membrane protein YckC